jgi:hypothetical protein
MLEYKAGSYLSWRDNVPWAEMAARLNRQLDAKAAPIELDRQAGALGKKILRENAVGFLCWMPRNLINFLMPDITPLLERTHLTAGNRGTLDVLRRQGVAAACKAYFGGYPAAAALTVIYSCFYLLTLVLVPLGLWWLWRQPGGRAAVALLAGIVLYLWVIPTGNLDWRFRMPAAPLLFVVITAGLAVIGPALNIKIWRKDHVQK